MTSRTTPAERQPRKLWVRLVALAAVLLAGWHIFASFLWIAPFSANAREIVPGNALSSYMLPMFGQSWSVFAPEPINGDFHFNVRAVVEAGGERTETGWVSATDVELSMIRYNLAPPRAGIQSTELASSFKTSYDALTDVQRTIASGDFTTQQWEVGLRAALENEGENASVDAAQTEENATAVDDFMSDERRATAYATQVARAVWGDDVVQVQYRVSRQNVIPFAQRHNPRAERPEPTVVLPGWRTPTVEPGQDEENFARVFRRQFERISE